MRYANGEVYHGEFLSDVQYVQKGQRHGWGTMYYTNGWAWTGIWENGAKVHRRTQAERTRTLAEFSPGKWTKYGVLRPGDAGFDDLFQSGV